MSTATRRTSPVLAAAKAECDLIEKWSNLNPWDRQDLWKTLTRAQQRLLGETFRARAGER